MSHPQNNKVNLRNNRSYHMWRRDKDCDESHSRCGDSRESSLESNCRKKEKECVPCPLMCVYPFEFKVVTFNGGESARLIF